MMLSNTIGEDLVPNGVGTEQIIIFPTYVIELAELQCR